MALAPVPVPLEKAIQKASKKENVPPDILDAIWRHESGSTYPNPYKNSSGYGGLFGTKDWSDTTQGQANYAATILHNLLIGTHGNLADAVGEYGSGKPDGGAYLDALHSLGATSSGVIPGYNSGGTQSLPPGSSVPPPADSHSGSGGGRSSGTVGGTSVGGFHLLGTPEDLALRAIIGAAGIALIVIAFILLSKAVTGRNLVAAGAGFVTGRQVEKRKEAERQEGKQRSAERHESTVAVARQRVKTDQARATELRTRTRHRRRAKQEQDRELERSYVRGATDQAHHDNG